MSEKSVEKKSDKGKVDDDKEEEKDNNEKYFSQIEFKDLPLSE